MFDPAPALAESLAARRYELLDHIRRSRDFDIYDAWSGERHCRCVIKAPRPDRADDHVLLRRLEREGRLLCGLMHPHILRGYELLPAPAPAAVMDTLRGETLSHLLAASKRLSAAEGAVLGLQLCSAIAYLHEQGYLQLDLKPSNIVVDGGRAIVVDLSLAQPPGHGPHGLGTSRYHAPEQALGRWLGPAADVWGIGALLFAALTGRPAFGDGAEDEDSSHVPADEEEAKVYPQLEARAPKIRSLRRLPASLGSVVDACLDFDPACRPSVAELAAALELVPGGGSPRAIPSLLRESASAMQTGDGAGDRR
jgi:eukaryotic-like serine/threonine-protein kinase